MGVNIQLSTRSQELMLDYSKTCGLALNPAVAITQPIALPYLISWIERSDLSLNHLDEKTKKDMEFTLAELRAELLRDLFAGLKGDDTHSKKAAIDNSWQNKSKFVLLASAGTLLAACEGFDGMATMLGILSAPSAVILLAGIAFSALSILVFYGFDLVQVSQNLGIKLSDAPKLLDIYLIQMEEIKNIRRKIDNYSLSNMTATELEELDLIILMLQKRFNALVESGKQFDDALHGTKMKVIKNAVSGVAGLLFFGGGFFAGQSVAIFMLSLFMASVTPTILPVILFSVVVGVAAFSLYWYVQRVGVQRLVSAWFGLDEEKLEQICDADKLQNEEKKLNSLKEKVAHSKGVATKIMTLEEKMSTREAPELAHSVHPDKLSSNRYRLYALKPASSPSNAENHHCVDEYYDEASGYGGR